MEKIKITCDSTCDLTPELYEKYNIEVIPLGITLGEDLHYDGLDVTPADLYAFAKRTGTLPKTSAISIGMYESVFSRYTDDGYQVIHINLSSTLSSCYQNACIAAADLSGVFPVDSLCLSACSGLLAIAASEMAESGMPANAIVASLNEMRNRHDASFILQTLEYMKLGGRCSSVAALGANLLKLRPEISVKDGKMGVGKKYRGSRLQSITDYVRSKLTGRTDIDLKRIFVAHSGLPEEEFEKMVALVKELQPFEEVLTTTAGCTISTHCGPECFGLLFLKKE